MIDTLLVAQAFVNMVESQVNEVMSLSLSEYKHIRAHDCWNSCKWPCQSESDCVLVGRLQPQPVPRANPAHRASQPKLPEHRAVSLTDL